MKYTSVNWKALIGAVGQQRALLAQRAEDPVALTYCGVGASESRLELLEASLGYQLDAQFRELLGAADGWPHLVSDISLFGVDDINAGAGWVRAGTLLGLVYSENTVLDLPLMGELFPIAVSSYQSDVLAIVRTGTVTGGGHPVLWFANTLVETFDNLEQFLLFVLEDAEAQTLTMR